MELTILKELNYKTLYTTSYDFILFYLEVFKYVFNPNNQFIQNLTNFAQNIMKQNINTNIFLSMSQSDYAFTCLNQAFIQIGMSNIMNQIRNILMIFNINNFMKKNKSLNDNNTCNDNDKNVILHHNLEVNLLSLRSF